MKRLLLVALFTASGADAAEFRSVQDNAAVPAPLTSQSPSANCAASLRTAISSCGFSICMKICGAFGTSSERSLT